MKNEKITVSKIAELAGVSPATVSRVINHRSIVKETTIRQVEKAMAILGYPLVPKPAASLSRQPLIVLNIPAIENFFYQDVIRGAQASAKAHGCHLLINECPLSRSSIQEFCSLLNQINASGTILMSVVPEDLLNQIHTTTPLVQCCEYNENSSYPYVSIDDFLAAKSATEHLISCGCRKLAMINGPQTYKYAQKRQEGFLSTADKADIFVPQNWLIQLPEVNYEMAYAAICRILNAETRPNAFFVISDIFAAAVIRAAKRFHLNIPRDIMVVGFDNINLSTMTTPSITTISQPSFQQGYSACELLLEMINNPGITPRSLLFDTELIVRESTMKL